MFARIQFVSTLLLLGSLALIGSAQAQVVAPAIVVSSGSEDGNYHLIASRLQAQLSAQHEKYAEVLTSHGSFHNLTRLAEPPSPVAIAFAQADASSAYLVENPEFASDFTLLADLGKECVFLLTSRRGGVKRFADLKSGAPHTIAVGYQDSGPAITYRYMTRLEPELRATVPAYLDGMEALLLLKEKHADSRLEATMVVQRPRVLSEALEYALEHPKDFRVVEIRPGDLHSTALPDGTAVYTHEKVTLRGSAIETLCTRGLLLGAKSKIDEEMSGILSALMLKSLQEIAPGATTP